MHALTAIDSLKIWSEGLTKHLIDKALLILSVADPNVPFSELTQLSIGQRNHQLLQLRKETFGQRLSCFTHCPHCQEPLEFNVDVADLYPYSQPELTPKPEQETLIDGYAIKFRSLTSQDLALVINERQDAEHIRQRLLEQSVISLSQDQQSVTLSQLPEEALIALNSRLAEADPGADMSFNVSCPACEKSWQAVFDIVAFFWQEIDDYAKQLMLQIHKLASVYGWREADILNMNPTRRQFYLGLIDG